MDSSAKKIAILGATGHIAKNLIHGFCREDKYELHLFARFPERVIEFMASTDCGSRASISEFNRFGDGYYDVIINCVGIGDPAKVRSAGISIFRLTEAFDNLILDYLENHPSVLYINFSSGATYGTDFSMPVESLSCRELYINNIKASDYYSIAKINTEAKHRAMSTFNIIDLRIFGFFSRFIDLTTQYFLTDIISCIKQEKELLTSSQDIVRDYVHPEDLLSLVNACIQYSPNDVFDVYSLKPVTKFEILDYFSSQYGLNYTVDDSLNIPTATGAKSCYYSNNRKAEEIGYSPKFTSLDSIAQESRRIIV